MPKAPDTSRPGPRLRRSDHPYRLTVEQFDRMVAAGILREGEPVYLWDGLLIAAMTETQLHANALGNLHDLLVAAVPAGYFVNQEKPIVLAAGSKPQPDLTIVRGQRSDYRRQAPSPIGGSRCTLSPRARRPGRTTAVLDSTDQARRCR
ncbi:MAG: Uma2 family endonuclease [Isosphaeraceae bacterium]|nr:Uma2 family endonuclease [Isosphaeraceae bacterium]